MSRSTIKGHAGAGGASLAAAVRDLYAQGQSDYSLEPVVLVDEQGQPIGRVQDGDAVIFCCRRGEREVELTEAFTEIDFPHFPRQAFQDLKFVIFTLYHEKFKDLPVAFAPTRIKDTLGEVVSRAGLRQLRTAESEKFAHVTFFFNGGSNQAFEGEDDWFIPSPRGIPFDQAPALSLPEVARKARLGIEAKYDLIVANFANGDVIGHTANQAAKLRCAEIVDQHVDEIVQAALAADTVLLITADHGNLEVMLNPDGSPHVAHTTNPVPLILIDPRSSAPAHPSPVVGRGAGGEGRLRSGGALADLAPTILQALDVPQPDSMDGASLAPGYDWGGRRRVFLLILDGWGIGKDDATNPIALASTPVWDDLLKRYPCTTLNASGQAVGLQPGKAGNSEAGHMNIGAGHVVPQDDARLDQAMKDGSFYANETLNQTIQEVKRNGNRLHLIGLLSEKSSHGSVDYPLALLRMAKAAGLEKVYLHMIFDGRSTEPGSAPALLEKLGRQMGEIGVGQIVTGIGRGLALDRDGNYARIQKAYHALVYGTGTASPRCSGESKG